MSPYPFPTGKQTNAHYFGDTLINHLYSTKLLHMTLFLELRRHGKLAEKRSPMYEKSKFAKFWIYTMAAFWLGYLFFFGIMFAFIFDKGAIEPYHVMNQGLIFVMAIDFILRFAFQKPPTQEVKPYLLLPIRRNRLMDFLLFRSGLNEFNFLWLFMFVPFATFTISVFYGALGVITYCIGIWLLMVLNNYWYVLCRTLIGESIWWTALPLCVYGIISAIMFIPEKSFWFDYSLELGDGFIEGKLWAFAAVLACIVLLWLINRYIISKLIYSEINKVEDTTVKNISEYGFLDRYGELGEYIRLELKMLFRNRMCKNSLRMAMLVVLGFTLLLSFTGVYDGSGMKSFIVIYNFVLFGVALLSPLMTYEGNYIDGLMSCKESIYTLLLAKYILYSMALLIPFVLMIPAVVTGKIALLTSVSWLIFCMGACYFGMFQLAVYNNRTFDLNSKVISRQGMGTGVQNLVGMASFGLPLLFNAILISTIGQTNTSWVLIVVGALFIVTSNLWLKNIYRRFMKRRYKNMEGFRDSRQK